MTASSYVTASTGVTASRATSSRPPAAPGEAEAVGAAVAFILRSTRQRPQTEAEIERKLVDRSVEEPVRRAAIDRAKALGALDDAAFARAWVADRGEGRGYGIPRLREELTRRGVDTVIVEDALDTLADRDTVAVASELARQRVRRLPASLDAEAVARRLAGYLVRRGYEQGLATRVALTVSGLDRRWD